MKGERKTVSLNGQWQLAWRELKETPKQDPQLSDMEGLKNIPVAVPGGVEIALMEAGLLDDPRDSDKGHLCKELETREWWYTTEFDTPNCTVSEIAFDGIDTTAWIFLNGESIGAVNNMFMKHVLPVSLKDKGQKNQLAVCIRPAIIDARAHEIEPACYNLEIEPDTVWIRKAAHTFAWDIFPRLVTAGLWRGVSLVEQKPKVHVGDMYWATVKVDTSSKTATVLCDWNIEADLLKWDGLKVRARFLDGDTVVHENIEETYGSHGRMMLSLEDVNYWWPRHYGDPFLYTVEFAVLDKKDKEVAVKRESFGIRTVELVRDAMSTIAKPGKFEFIVNGIKVYAMGANWIPLDAIHGRDTEQLEQNCQHVWDLNCNMIRSWGGGVYEDDAFFDWCDSHGIMVWQDFMLACAIYPQCDEFAARIIPEAEQVVHKFRNRASLALWSGNNEIDNVHVWQSLGFDPNKERISRIILPEILRRLDPLREWLPSCPYQTPEVVAERDSFDRFEIMSEVHLWRGTPYFKDDFYATKPAAFVSEVGYGALRQDNPHLANYKWAYKRINYLFQDIPEDIEAAVLASQIVQAEGIKFWVEHWRGRQPQTGGVLWWSLRDGWPRTGGAVVDYYHKRKLAFAYISRAQRDLLVMMGESHYDKHAIKAINNSHETRKGSAIISSIESGKTIAEVDFTLKPNDCLDIGSIPVVTKPDMWLIRIQDDHGEAINHYKAGPRFVPFEQYQGWIDSMEIPKDVFPANKK